MTTAMAALTHATFFFVVAKAAMPAQQQSAAEKQEPGGIIGTYITNTLFPLLKEEVERIQQEVDASLEPVKQCSQLMWSAEKEVEHKEEILQSDEGEKYECLAEEHRLHKVEKDKCGDYVAHLLRFAGNADYRFPQAADRSVETVGSFFAQKDNINNDANAIDTKKGECVAATDECEKQHGECVLDEETIEKFYCSMLYQKDAACAAYSKCYDEKTKEVEKTETKMKELEAETKDHYKKLSCFQDGVGNLEMDPARCDHEMFDTSHFEVNYPGVPPAEECVHLMEMRRDFSKVKCSGGEVVWNKKTPAPAPSSTATTNSTDADLSPVAPQPQQTPAPAAATNSTDAAVASPKMM